jgi:pyruvate dehydrogenase (quinone)
MGARGYTIERPDQAGPVLDEALAAPGPAIIQAIVDPNEPLLPAVVSDAYAEHLRQALAAGAQDAAAIREALGREPARSMMGRHRV